MPMAIILTYALVNDAGGRFKINETTGVVSVADAGLINFEAAGSHAIIIKAKSSDGSTIEKTFTIDITNATEGDTDNAITNLIDNDADANTISENILADALVHITALATDADADKITYALVNDAGGRFTIDKKHRNRKSC